MLRPKLEKKDFIDGLLIAAMKPENYPIIGAGLGYIAGAGTDLYINRGSNRPFYHYLLPYRLAGAATGALAGYGVQKVVEKKSAYEAMIDVAELLIGGRR